MLKRLSDLSNRQVLGVLLLFTLLSSGYSLVINLTSEHANFAEWGESWLQNFSTEMFGALLTFVLLEIVIGNRQDKETLVRQLRSSSSEESKRAAEELWEHGWLSDGSLKKAYLRNANLQEVDLSDAFFQQADLAKAILIRAKIRNATLRDTDLREANLQEADLTLADLRGALLVSANLQGANLENAIFDESTTLPNGEKWTTTTDMSVFTSP
ncbi:MAG: pentapeptide repeat-containing protein [Burkholderiales bacterium]|nr:pentapeptide repeat-containing protein [Anaerolineae bacterium]